MAFHDWTSQLLLSHTEKRQRLKLVPQVPAIPRNFPGESFPAFDQPGHRSVFSVSGGCGLQRVSLHAQQSGASLWVNQPLMVLFYKSCLLSEDLHVGEEHVSLKVLLRIFSMWFLPWSLKLSVFPKPRKQHCYKGARKPEPHIRNEVLIKRKSLCMGAQELTAGAVRRAPGLTQVGKWMDLIHDGGTLY